jgi:hypothetical protein
VLACRPGRDSGGGLSSTADLTHSPVQLALEQEASMT